MRTGVLLMAHGSPERLDEVEKYLCGILTHRPPAPQIVREFQERYRRIGGRSPLADITRHVARALENRAGLPVFVGMRHGKPPIAEAVEKAREAGVERLVGVPMAPPFARVSVEAYHQALRRTGMASTLVSNWHLEPALLEYWRRETRGREFVLFTAHSIPAEGSEPYPTHLREMVEEIASGPYALAYQSKSSAPVPWLGPDVPEALQGVRGRARRVSVAPIGFVCDHLEVLYDLDVLHRGEAERMGFEWERIPMPNGDPLLVEALASVVGKHR